MTLRTAAVALAVFLLLPVATAVSSEWRIDAAQSRLGFVGTQGGSAFEGRFASFRPTVRFDPADLDSSRIVVVIETASVGTGDRSRDDAVKGADWFDVARFPEARLETGAIRVVGQGRYEAEATLTIRDVSAPILLPFTLQPADGDATRATGEVKIDRTTFGVGRGQWAAGDVVGKPVVIGFELLATTAAASP